MTNPLSTPDRLPLLLTGKRLGEALGRYDAKHAADYEKFKVETVERLEEAKRLYDQLETVAVAVLGLVQLNNLAMPQTEEEVSLQVARDGFWHDTTDEIATRAKAAGRQVRRVVTRYEYFTAEPERVAEAEQVMAQIEAA